MPSDARRHRGQIDPLVDRIGAANTVVFGDDGALSIYNTDYAGALTAVTEALGVETAALRDWPVAVLGAGGVARALVAGFCHVGAAVTVYNRTFAKAEALAQSFGCEAAALDAVGERPIRLLVNGTKVGMSPHVDSTPAPASALHGTTAVFDTIYNPLETRLLREAAARGATVINGQDMFIHQALAQYLLFTGTAGDEDVMRTALQNHR